MKDSDFLAIHEELTGRLGPFKGQTYAYDPFASDARIEEWRKKGVTIIKKASIPFMRELIGRLRHDNILPPEKLIAFFASERMRLTSEHMETHDKDDGSDGACASLMYQDGLLHALEDVISGTTLGNHKNTFEERLREVLEIKCNYNDAGDAIEVAYWSGQCEIYARFIDQAMDEIPAYFHPRKQVPIKKYKR